MAFLSIKKGNKAQKVSFLDQGSCLQEGMRLNMKTAIIVLNYNDYKNTKKYVEIIKEYKNIDKIVVVDNLSPNDDYEKLLELKSDKIIVLQSEKNGGYSYGNNYGIRYLDSLNEKIDNIIISNPDVYVTEEAIQKCIDELNANEKTAIVAPCMRYSDNKIARRSSWKIRTYFRDVIHSTRLLELLFYGVLRNGEYSKNDYEKNKLKVECIAGSFFIIKHDIFKEIGYFDENVFLFYEEDILGAKLKKLGYDIYSLNDISFIHYESRTINKTFSAYRKLQVLNRSKLYFQREYNHINCFQVAFLKLLFAFRNLEMSVEILLRKLLKK